jgi:anti-sigma B factor antagonist
VRYEIVNQRQADSVATAPGCGINEQWIGRTAVIAVSGVLDMLTSPQLETAFSTVSSKHPSSVIVDLSEVEFLASAGMGVLVAERDRADGRYGFAVVACGPATSRPLKLVGLAEVVGLFPTLAEARAALEA